MLEFAPRAADARIVAAELFDQLLIAVDNAMAALDAGLAVESPSGVCSLAQKQSSWSLRRMIASCGERAELILHSPQNTKWVRISFLSPPASAKHMLRAREGGPGRDLSSDLESNSPPQLVPPPGSPSLRNAVASLSRG